MKSSKSNTQNTVTSETQSTPSQLNTLKKSTKEYLEAHNKVVTLFWEVKHDIAVNKALLKKAVESKDDASTITNKINYLEEKQKILKQCLDENNSITILKQKFAEIEKLENELNPNKKINFKSPYSL